MPAPHPASTLEYRCRPAPGEPGSRSAFSSLALCSIRALLHFAVERRVAAALERNPRYDGSYDDVDISVLRLSYSIEELRLVKRNGRVPVPFVTAERIDYALDARALLRGRIRGAIAIARASLNLVDGPTAAVRQGPAGVDWRITLRRLFPTNVNRIEVRDGTLHFRNFHTDPEVDVYLGEVEIDVTNLAWRSGTQTESIGLRGKGVPMKSGAIEADVTLHRGAREPSFDCTFAVHGAQLAQWNDLWRAYLGIDVERGTARVDGELHARDGALSGTVTPSLAELQVLGLTREIASQSVFTSLGEGLIDVGVVVLRDPERHAIEARIPISGTIRNPKHDDWASAQSLLREALVDWLQRAGEVVPGAG